ncbi:cysteine desulfurase family protein [Thermopolyspora sp. NPDC052614]|uniref:cysteine desulfurase family protein n=1 Tax=Thermopolyspora sp. NPDC052614 TaxID=3155682 RepID=UPI0034318BCB
MIYLDYNATTPVDPRVLEAMLPMFATDFANPSSKHAAGRDVAARVERARGEVGALVGARRKDVVFTSGATESVNLAIHGVLASAGPARRRVLVGATEHKAVIAAAEAAATARGGTVEAVAVHDNGTIDLDDLERRLGADVALVAVMAANNETGVINDVRHAATLAHRAGAPLLCDLTQAAGKIPVAIGALGVDVAAWSAHKLYGPKGVGALAAAPALRGRLTPLISGGGQERGLRAGTVNAAGIVGFGRASAIAAELLDSEAVRQQNLVRLLRLRLTQRLTSRYGPAAVEVNGAGAPRLPNTVSLRFRGADADAVLACLPDVAVSAGSACGSGDPEPSHVLLAMGLDAEAALSSLRFSVGRPTTEQEVVAAADRVADAVIRVRELRAEQTRERPSQGSPVAAGP